ncbi:MULTISPECIES: hypothetical protein [Marinomonas]|uniref:hypothetical protein n=2 Tax=Oceanospirillaceae TaxID=135620 RepID=UPI0014044D0F|nr:hypothetical protein [Marinomonas sp. KMM3893]
MARQKMLASVMISVIKEAVFMVSTLLIAVILMWINLSIAKQDRGQLFIFRILLIYKQ